MSPVPVQQNSSAGGSFETPFDNDSLSSVQKSSTTGSSPSSSQSDFSSNSDVSRLVGQPPQAQQPAVSFSDNAGGASTQDSATTTTTTRGLVGVDGNSVPASETRPAQLAVPVNPAAQESKSFDISELDPVYWWFLAPAILIPIFLFRFVMGTSSAYELEKYKYRGPSVKDPEASNVRGRFKKRTGSENSDPDLEVGQSEPAASTAATSDPDDDLSFLDDVDDAVVPVPANAQPTESLPSSAAIEASSGQPDVAAPLPVEASGADSQDNFSSNVTASADAIPPQTPSESDAVNDQADSDVDFDFFADDDDVQSSPDATPTEFTADEQPIESSGGVEPEAGESSEFVLEEPNVGAEPETDNDEFDFLNDDSGDDFQLDDEEAIPAVAAVVPDDLDGIDSEDFGDVAESVDADLDSVEEEADDSKLEPVVAAAASAAVVATATGGSWMKRLFGRRNKRVTEQEDVVEDAVEDTAIAAVADPAEDADDLNSADLSSIDDPTLDEIGSSEVTVASEQTFTDSGEFDLSDSRESFSLDGDGDDDSMDGMFDDDSDAGYQFDAEEESLPAIAGSEVENLSAETSLASGDVVEDVLDSAEFGDDLTQSEQVAAMGDAPVESPVNLDESLSDSHDEPSDSIGSVAIVAPGISDQEFAPVGHPAGSEELPLLEDRMLDDIVEAEAESVAAISTDSTEQSTDQMFGDDELAVGSGAALADDELGVSDETTQPTTESSSDLLAELRQRIEELESQNAEIEADRTSLKTEVETLRDESSITKESTAEGERRLAELEQQLEDERQSIAELETKLTAEADAKQQASVEAEKARTEAEQARTEVERARTEAEQAASEAAELRVKAEAKASSDYSEASAGMLGGSLLAAAGGAVAGAAVASDSGDAADADDPFRLEPEQVKKMLKKLKSERKKRLKTREHFLEADAKRREVASTLQRVSSELEGLKLEFQKAAESSTDGVPKSVVAELKQKLDSTEDALKKNKSSS